MHQIFKSNSGLQTETKVFPQMTLNFSASSTPNLILSPFHPLAYGN